MQASDEYWAPVADSMRLMAKHVDMNTDVILLGTQLVDEAQDEVELLSKASLATEDKLRAKARELAVAKKRFELEQNRTAAGQASVQDLTGQGISEELLQLTSEANQTKEAVQKAREEFNKENSTAISLARTATRNQLLAGVAEKWGKDEIGWDAMMESTGVSEDYITMVTKLKAGGAFSPAALKSGSALAKESQEKSEASGKKLALYEQRMKAAEQRQAAMQKLQDMAGSREARTAEAKEAMDKIEEEMKKVAKEESDLIVELGEATEKLSKAQAAQDGLDAAARATGKALDAAKAAKE